MVVASYEPSDIAFHVDDPESVFTYPAVLKQWIAAGGDPNRWETPQFCADLQMLRRIDAPIFGAEEFNHDQIRWMAEKRLR